MRFAFAPALLFALLGMNVAVARAAEPPAVVIVFDGSGSMWGKTEGERQSKFFMARDAIRSSVLPTGKPTRFGLIAFGHRRGADCSDVEVLAKAETGSGERIMAALDKLNPRGKGPITAALREAAKELGPATAPANIVLIHDDVDNCQADPCSAITDLRQAHPRVAVNVISIGVKPEEAQRMSCLARETGGRMFEVQTAAQMTAAVDEASRPARSERPSPSAARPANAAIPQPARPPAAEVPAGKPGLQLSARLSNTTEPLTLPIRWLVTKADDKGSQLRWEGDSAAPLLEVPTGRYDVEARIGFVVLRGSVDAVAGKSTVLSLSLDAGLVDLFPEAESKRPEMRDALMTFTRVDEQNSERVAIQRGMVPWTVLLPGTYTVALTHGSLRIERSLVVKAGERTAIDQAFHVGDIELSAVASAGGPPLEGMIFSVLEDDPDAPQGRREVARSAASRALFTLPAGTYYVVASHGTAEARDRITLRAGEVQRKVMTVESGELTVAVRLAGQRGDITEPISIRLERQGGEAKEILYASRPTAAFEAAAGRYRVETRIGFTNVRAEREFDLKAGSREQVVIEHPAGSLKLRLLDRPGGSPVPDVAWDVRDGAGRTVWLGNETEAQPLLLAGRYTVRAQTRDRRIEAPVEVRAGEVRAVDLSAQ